MSQQIKIELLVDDKGTATISNFAGNATAALDRARVSAKGFADTWQGLSVGIASAITIFEKMSSVLRQASEYMQLGAMAQQAEDSFRRVAESAGVAADRLIANMTRASAGTVDNSDLMQRAVKGMMLGMTDEAMVKIAEMGRLGARVAGVSVSQAIEGITNAIATNIPRALKQYGLALGPEIAIITAAQKAGVEGINLLTVAQINYDIQLAKHGLLQANNSEQAQKFHAQLNDLKETIGIALMSALQALFGGLQRIGSQFQWVSGQTYAFVASAAAAAAWAARKIGFAERANEIQAYADSVQKNAERILQYSRDLNAKGLDNMRGPGGGDSAAVAQLQATIKGLEKQKEALLKSIKDQTDAAIAGRKESIAPQKSTLDMMKALDAAYFKEKADKIKNTVELMKASYVNELTINEYVYGEKDRTIAESYERGRALAKLEAEARTKADRDKLKDNLFIADREKALDAKRQQESKDLADERIVNAKRIVEANLKGAAEMAAYDQKQVSDTIARERSAGGTRISVTADVWEKIGLIQAMTGEKITASQIGDIDNIINALTGEYQALSDFYSQIAGMEEKYRQNKLEWIERERQLKAFLYKDEVAAAMWAAQEKIKFERTLFDAKAQLMERGLGDMSSMFASLSGMYDKSSSGYARMQEAAQAMIVLQKAVAVVNAVSAVAASAAAPWPAGFVSMAAMAASMGSLLGSIGVSFGGGGSSAPTAKIGQLGGDTTVLGGAYGQGSKSIEDSFKLLEDTYSMEYTKLSDIYGEMRDLNGNITALSTSLVRSIATGQAWTAPARSTSLWAGMVAGGGGLDNAMNDLLRNVPILGSISNALITPLNNFSSWLSSNAFGGDLTLNAQGIRSLGNPNVGALLGGAKLPGQGYTTVTESGGWFGSDKDITTAGALDAQTNMLLTNVFKGMGQSLISVAKGLGQDTGAALAYGFKDFYINLNGLTGEQVTNKLNETFSAIADTAITSLFGEMLSQYQQLDEGLMQTAVRLITDKEVILRTLEDTGHSFTGTALDAIKLSESLIKLAGDLKTLTDAVAVYQDKFFTEAEKQTRLQESLASTLGNLNMVLPASRDGYRQLVEAQNLNTEAGQKGYVTLLNLADAADTFYENLESSFREALDGATTALDNYVSSVSSAADNARRLADEYKGITKSIEDAIREIRGGGVTQSKSTFDAAYSRAMAGDRESLSALPALAKDYLSDAMASSKSLIDYNRERGKILGALEDASKVGVIGEDVARYQAGVLDGVLGVLGEIKTELEKGSTADQTFIQNHMTELGIAFGLLTGYATQVDTLTGVIGNITYKLGPDGLWKSVDGLNTVIDPALIENLSKMTFQFGPGGLQGATSSATDWLSNGLVGGIQTNVDWLMNSFQPAIQTTSDKFYALQTAMGSFMSSLSNIPAPPVTPPYVPPVAPPVAPPVTPPASSMSGWDEAAYLAANPDVAGPGGILGGYYTSGLEHYLRTGQAEGRSATGTAFDEAAYLASNLDVAMAVYDGVYGSGLQHYLDAGAVEGRSPLGSSNAAFNEASYLASNPDVAAAVAAGTYMSGEQHWLWSGQAEGRPGFADGGDFAGGWRVVGERGPELEYTGPSRIVSNEKSKNLIDITPLLEEMRAVRAALKELQSSNSQVAKNTGSAASTLQTVTRGGRAVQTEAFV